MSNIFGDNDDIDEFNVIISQATTITDDTGLPNGETELNQVVNNLNVKINEVSDALAANFTGPNIQQLYESNSVFPFLESATYNSQAITHPSSGPQLTLIGTMVKTDSQAFIITDNQPTLYGSIPSTVKSAHYCNDGYVYFTLEQDDSPFAFYRCDFAVQPLDFQAFGYSTVFGSYIPSRINTICVVDNTVYLGGANSDCLVKFVDNTFYRQAYASPKEFTSLTYDFVNNRLWIGTNTGLWDTLHISGDTPFDSFIQNYPALENAKTCVISNYLYVNSTGGNGTIDLSLPTLNFTPTTTGNNANNGNDVVNYGNTVLITAVGNNIIISNDLGVSFTLLQATSFPINAIQINNNSVWIGQNNQTSGQIDYYVYNVNGLNQFTVSNTSGSVIGFGEISAVIPGNNGITVDGLPTTNIFDSLSEINNYATTIDTDLMNLTSTVNSLAIDVSNKYDSSNPDGYITISALAPYELSTSVNTKLTNYTKYETMMISTLAGSPANGTSVVWGTSWNTTIKNYLAPRAMIIDTLYVICRTSAGAGTVSYTLIKNEVATALQLTFSNNALQQIVSNPITFAAGDTYRVITNRAGITHSDIQVSVLIRYL
jgi:hypothetical protein